MTICYSDTFKKAVQMLSNEEKRQLAQKLRLFVDNPRRPSLRSKKMAGQAVIFESSVNMDIRMTWQYTEDGVLLRNIWHHDTALNKP